MEHLVNEKVDAFWRGVESGISKRGQVWSIRFAFLLLNLTRTTDLITVTFSEKRPKKSWFQVCMGKEEVPWEQWCALSFLPGLSFNVFRIINAELRQPKSDRGASAPSFSGRF
jgi:hypothetical protein